MSETDELEEAIVEVIDELDAPGFDDLAGAVDASDAVLDEALAELQFEREIRFSGHRAGWLVV